MPEEIELEIDKTGQVRVHIKGVKGKQCVKVAEFLAGIVGKEKSRELTSEYYEPEGEVRIHMPQKGG